VKRAVEGIVEAHRVPTVAVPVARDRKPAGIGTSEAEDDGGPAAGVVVVEAESAGQGDTEADGCSPVAVPVAGNRLEIRRAELEALPIEAVTRKAENEESSRGDVDADLRPGSR
jgi:hypothetical protein